MQERKTRSDKGTVKLNERDEFVLRWIAEQGAINLSHLALLLSRNRERGAQTTTDTLAVSILSQPGVKQVIRRWLKAEWVEYTNPFRASIHPGYVWLTTDGLKNFAPEYRYVHYRIGTLKHFDGINQVRLWVEGQMGFESWVSERILRQGKHNPHHIPDAEILFASKRLAIEVELERKTHRRLVKIMDALEAEYEGVWYFVNRDSEAGVTHLAEDYSIRVRHLDTLSLYGHAQASSLSS